jgi:hypothetical protein
MAGKAKHAELLAKHIGAPIDAACMIDKTGATTTWAVGGVIGLAAKAAVDKNKELAVTRNGWLALGPDRFWLVKGDNSMGKPKGEATAQIAYADVAAVELKDGKLSTRADVALSDGRIVAFESRRRGTNKSNGEVLELLARRCDHAGASVAA